MDAVFKIILMLIGFGCVLFLAYVTTRYIAGKANTGMRGRYLNIVETITLGMDKKICLVKAGDEFVLIAVSGKKVDFLCDVKIEEYLTDSGEDKKKVFDFKNILDNYVNSQKNNENKSEVLVNKAEGDSFRANLSKLRAITGRFNNQGRKDGDENTNEK